MEQMAKRGHLTRKAKKKKKKSNYNYFSSILCRQEMRKQEDKRAGLPLFVASPFMPDGKKESQYSFKMVF